MTHRPGYQPTAKAPTDLPARPPNQGSSGRPADGLPPYIERSRDAWRRLYDEAQADNRRLRGFLTRIQQAPQRSGMLATAALSGASVEDSDHYA